MKDIPLNYIRNVFLYSQKYKEKTFVIYIDNQTIQSHSFFSLIKDIVYVCNAGIKTIIVPGVDITILGDLSNAYKKRKFVVSEDDVVAIQNASFSSISNIITQFARYRKTAVLGNWIRALGHGVINGVDYKQFGFVDRIDVETIEKLLSDNVIPIFPAIGWNYTGTPYFVHPLEIATHISITIKSSKLIFITNTDVQSYFEKLNVKTILEQSRYETVFSSTCEDNPKRIGRMTVSTAKKFLQDNKKNDSSFLEIIMYGIQALEKNVERVHIVDGTEDGSLLVEIFFNQGSGLMVYSNEYDAISPMKKEDIGDVMLIMQPLVKQRILKPRTIDAVLKQIEDFVIYKTDGQVHGIAALHDIGNGLAEIAALATSMEHNLKGTGIGKKIMLYLLAKAKKQKYKKVIVFTLKTSDWFERLGFQKLEDISELSPKRRKEYVTSKRKSRIYFIETKKISQE